MTELLASILTKSQKKTFRASTSKHDIVATVRYDDECGNGHNTFAITGEIYSKSGILESCGCIHGTIKKHFPDLAPFIKWHLFNSDGPTQYLANTLYFAKDVDHNGLKAGEFRSYVYDVVIAGGEVLFTSRVFYSFRNWLHRNEAAAEAESFYDKIKPELSPHIVERGHGAPSEGKPVELDSARATAVWPDATLEQLQSEEQLLERLPALIADFENDMEKLGFTY